ncbi:MAG: hypothetical protein P4L16_01285 [Chlamydiales bacterium]|nr:hypothetical protein [Chlamydiales bacterium]
MKVLNIILQLYWRLQYPVSLPEDVARALGIQANNNLVFTDFIRLLTSPTTSPTKLVKYMSRLDAEATFGSALRKERFSGHSLFSYYFNKGWLGFYLQFDQQSRLRRVYVQHRELTAEQGLELPLKSSF